jgi:bifunctional enzyme CysN/CysC
MLEEKDLIETDIHGYLSRHENKELLRFLTCGSVDDGKSTLIGRLLHDTQEIYEDQLAVVERDSARIGTTGNEIDLALLVDGLAAEREQGITIDVAYRYFSTDQRKFIIADTPGHEQYTRNMVTGASNCELAIILMDARKGVLPQTKRHSFISHLLGIKHIVVAVNKMDLAGYDESVFLQLKSDFLAFAELLGMAPPVFIPISALAGDNVVNPSNHMPWYKGDSLLTHLENVTIETGRNFDEFRFPVQYVNRPDLNFRGFCGTLAAGVVYPGDTVQIMPSGLTSKVKSIVTMDGDLDLAFAPMSVTLTLEDEVDISRGDMLISPADSAILSDQLEVNLVWMNDTPLTPGMEYLVKIEGKSTVGRIETLNYKTDVNTLKSSPADKLKLNEIGHCRLRLEQRVIVDPYTRHRTTGSFILIDRLSNATVAAGMVVSDASSSDNQVELSKRVSAQERAFRFGQKPAALVISAATQKDADAIAYGVERKLFHQGRAVTVLGPELAESSSRTAIDLLALAEIFNKFGQIAIIPMASVLPENLGSNVMRVVVQENAETDDSDNDNIRMEISAALPLADKVAIVEALLLDHIQL